MSHAAILAFALMLDAAVGEPEALWQKVPHPAVLMGRAVGWTDRKMNAGSGRLAAGALALAGLIVLAWGAGSVVAWFGWGVQLVAAAILLAQRSLVDHVAAVAGALHASLDEGRAAVALIVGRDTAEMDEAAVARAALESAAENLSDGVIAPAFWFLALGLPGLCVYKMVNTADSMIGHMTPEHAEFGRAAAKLDDVLNWIPARITALFIHLARYRRGNWDVVRRDAPLHRSPNAGWPEAAMAAALGVALSGPRSYHGTMSDEPWVNPDGAREIGPEEVDAGVATLWRAWGIGLACTALIALI